MESTRPVWWNAARTAPRPSLEGRARYDVVVVGGGLAGLLTALLVARAGRSVAVLEARQVGEGTSGRTTGKVSLLQGTKLSRAGRHNPADVVGAYVEASRQGQAWLRQFCERNHVPVEDRHATTYATSESGLQRARAEHEAALAAGLDVRWSDSSELPFPVLGAVRLDGQFQLDPMRLLDAVVTNVAAEGGVVHELARVRRIRRHVDEVEVETDSGARASCDHLVIATNQPVTDRGAYFARVRAQRSYAATFGYDESGAGWIPTGMHLSSDRSVRSVRSVKVGAGRPMVLVGGAGHPTGRGRPSDHLQELVAWAERVLPGATLVDAWSAQDQEPVVGLPYAGPVVPGDERIQVVTGFDKWGLSTAPATALLLAADLLGGSTPGWAEAFRTWSLRDVTALPSTALTNAEVARQFVCGHASRLRPGDDRPVCTHLGGVLSWNDAERSWDCPLHGSRFAEDGDVLEGPATRRTGHRS